MINPSSIAPSKALGKSVGRTCPPSPPSLCCCLLCCLFPQPPCTCWALGRCAHSAACLFSLKWFAQQMFQLSVLSFVSLQFCYRIGTVHVLLPSRFSKRKLFAARFPPRSKLFPHPTLHRCHLLGECVPSLFFISLFSTSRCLSLQPDYCIVLFSISDFSPASTPAAWLTE